MDGACGLFCGRIAPGGIEIHLFASSSVRFRVSVVRSMPRNPASLPIGISPRSISCDRMVNWVARMPDFCR